MNKITYKNIVNQTQLNRTNKIKRLSLAFLGGGIVALIGQAIYDLYYFVFNVTLPFSNVKLTFKGFLFLIMFRDLLLVSYFLSFVILKPCRL